MIHFWLGRKGVIKNLFLKDAGCRCEVFVNVTLVESEGPGPLVTVRTELHELQQYLDALP